MADHPQVIDVLLAGLDQAFDRKAWHGATLWGTLRTVTREEAAWRPSPERHNIWEIAVHCAYWKYIVRRRLTGDRSRSFPLEGSDWFIRPGDGSDGGLGEAERSESRADTGDANDADADGGIDADWERDRALLRREHEALRDVVASLSAEDLRVPRDARDPVTEIRGIANHDIYHTGQIRLLRILQ